MKPDHVLVPDWPAPPGVRAVCSTRHGGISDPPYDTLNLGDHVGDEEECVWENRARFSDHLKVRPVYLKQVHGAQCVTLDAQTPDGTEADACTTRDKDVACTIMVADCLPVLLATRDGTAVAAAHAGWRGLAGGVIEAAVQSLGNASSVVAWLGPCIGPRAFEVGPEVRNAFAAHDAQAVRHFIAHADGKYLANLQALARDRLSAIGVASVHGNDGSDAWCTVTNASRFFSHRRDRTSGRFAAAVWRV